MDCCGDGEREVVSLDVMSCLLSVFGLGNRRCTNSICTIGEDGVTLLDQFLMHFVPSFRRLE